LTTCKRAAADALVTLSLSFRASASSPVVAAVLLEQLVDRLRDRRGLGLELLDRGLLRGEVASDEQRHRDQLGLPLLLADDEVGLVLGLLVLVVDDQPRLGGLAPAVAGDEVRVVLQGLGPVVHEVLIHVVGVDQLGLLERREQLPRTARR
jgi:hypothetical protein